MTSIVDRNKGTSLFIGDTQEGKTLQELDVAQSEMELDTKPADGLIFSCSCGINNRVRVISLFATEQKANAFMQDRITPAATKYGLMPDPERTTMLDVQNAIILPTATEATVLYSIRFEGATLIQYLEVMDKLNLGESLSPGGCAHIAARLTSTSMQIVDLWETENAARLFYESTLPPILFAVGYTGQPVIETAKVHNTVIGQSANVRRN